MGEAYVCDKCDNVFRGECKYPIWFGEAMTKKKYCESCWHIMNKAAGIEIETNETI